MTNCEYERRYWALYACGSLSFAPKAQLTDQEYDVIIHCLGAIRACPRLPWMGEEVLVRPPEEAIRAINENRGRETSPWSRELVVAEATFNGGPVYVVTSNGHRIRRAMYRSTWVFPPGHPLADWRDD